MQGAAELASNVFGTGVPQVGVPSENIGGLVDSVEAPRFATVVGLAQYGANRVALGRRRGHRSARVDRRWRHGEDRGALIKFWLQDLLLARRCPRGGRSKTLATVITVTVEKTCAPRECDFAPLRRLKRGSGCARERRYISPSIFSRRLAASIDPNARSAPADGTCSPLSCSSITSLRSPDRSQ